MRVYIAGRITGMERAVYLKMFADRADRLRLSGLVPVNPAELVPTGCSCSPDHDWSCYMRNSLRALLDCDAITTLPDWERSHGARAEVFLAGVAGLRFLHLEGPDV